MRRLFVIMSLVCLTLAAGAVRVKTHRLSDGTVLRVRSSAPKAPVIRSLGRPVTTWDPNKTYRVPVILLSFSDCGFSSEEPREFYDRLFNERGYNFRHGPGCVADYFRDQSGGLFNLQFDVIGPLEATTAQKKSGDYGESAFRRVVSEADDLLDFSLYDWNDDGRVEAVVIIYAGYGGNEDVDVAEGCIWPNTGTFTTLTLDGMRVADYSASPELWSNDASCGIGTICHEFSHILGLPDLYPTSGNEFSVLDEWDLMDGGNYADDGWCPPCYSLHEREFMGWQKAETLDEPTTVTAMASLDSGGKGYKIVNDASPSEYYLLENRQWEGWDYMLPGHGLLITHVDYLSSAWTNNRVNTQAAHHRLDYFHADGLDYNYYDGQFGDDSPYQPDGRSIILHATAYPYADGEGGAVVDALTDTSDPAATLFHARQDGQSLMGKSVTDIRETDGLVSFQFTNTSTGIATPTAAPRIVSITDLQGRHIPPSTLLPPPSTIYIIRYSDGTTKKIIR